jgi:hypothetical protein
MVGVIGPVETEGKGSLGKAFRSALFECLLEATEVTPYAIAPFLSG